MKHTHITPSRIYALLRNINGLTKGDTANCGLFGIVKCTESAKESKTNLRKFKVSRSEVLRNGGNWTMKNLRNALTTYCHWYCH